MEDYLTPQRIDSLERALSHFLTGKFMTAHKGQKVLGLMAAASMAIPLGMLRARHIQRWLNSFHFHPKRTEGRGCWWHRTRTRISFAGEPYWADQKSQQTHHWQAGELFGRAGLSQRSVTVYTPQACASKNGQYLCILPHKSSRWDKITTLSPGGNRSAGSSHGCPRWEQSTSQVWQTDRPTFWSSASVVMGMTLFT